MKKALLFLMLVLSPLFVLASGHLEGIGEAAVDEVFIVVTAALLLVNLILYAIYKLANLGLGLIWFCLVLNCAWLLLILLSGGGYGGVFTLVIMALVVLPLVADIKIIAERRKNVDDQ